MQFSVLISVYHKEQPGHFNKALASIIDQSLPPSEIVLVIDGPVSVELETVVSHFTSLHPSLFKVIRLPVNQGLGNALKTGVLNCQYELVARMDSDDIALYNRFEKQIDFLRTHESISVVGSNVEEFDIVPGDLKIYKQLPECGIPLLRYAKHRNPLNHPSIVFRKQAVIEAGNYQGDILLFEDYMLYIRMLLKGNEFYNIQDNLIYFRIGNRRENIKRRRGWHYLKKEISFLLYANQLKYISHWELSKAILAKPVVRLLPLPVVLWLYKNFLRKKD